MRVPPPPHSAHDAILVERCRSGDQDAWRELVERYAGLVHGIVSGVFRLRGQEGEDVFQDVFVRAYLRLGTLREDGALRAWIAQIARNAALDALRRRTLEPLRRQQIDGDAYEEPLAALDDALSVRAALARLPEQQREILDRFFARDQSYQTISLELGVPAGTIASRISRALVAMRTELEPQGR
jgi:RNA polymerase sigma factor (sigma-70 family)